MNDMHREDVSGMDPTPPTLRCPGELIAFACRRAPEIAVVEAAPRASLSRVALDVASALVTPARPSGGLLGIVWRAMGSDVLPALMDAARPRRSW
jgi:hypothetical protein